MGAAPKQESAVERHDTPWLFGKFLEGISRDQRPALHFIHLMLPHVPWRYLPSGKEYTRVGEPTLPHGLINKIWGTDRWEVTQGQQRHLLQLGYVDSLLGQLLAKLKREQLYDSALVVLVADHGASFHPEGWWRDETADQFSDVLNVPLFVKLPGQQDGVVSERNVETIDILPTVADVLDLSPSWPIEGQSMIATDLPERPSKFSLRVRRRGLVRDPWDVETLRVQRQHSVMRKLGLFGSGELPGGLFRIGDRADLVGRRVSEIGIAGEATATEPTTGIELDQAWSYGQVDLDSLFIPAHVTGRVRFARPREASAELAISVNGIVQAVTRTFGHRGRRASFTAMVPEDAFFAGHNRVEVFEVGDRRGTTRLVPTQQPSSADFALVEVYGKEEIRSSNGRHIPVIEGHVRGHFDLRRGSMGSKLSGLAFGARRQAAKTVLVFVRGRLAAALDNGLEGIDRRSQAMELWRRDASFRIWVPDAFVSEVRVFAILGDAASEIAPKVRRTRPTSTEVSRAGAEVPKAKAEGLIFADGFESGSTGAWNQRRR